MELKINAIRMYFRIFFGTTLLLLLGNMSAASAQSTCVLGSGSLNGTCSNGPAGDCGPIYRSSPNSLFTFSRYNYYYNASELASAGLTAGNTISAIAWYKDNSAATNFSAIFEVWMQNTSDTGIGNPGQAWAALINGATQVYSNNFYFLTGTVGWKQLSFTSPFVYTGGALKISTNYDISQGSIPYSNIGISWRRDTTLNTTLSYVGATAPGLVQPYLRIVRPWTQLSYNFGVGVTEEASVTERMILLPNPANESVSIKINTRPKESIHLKILSLTSQLVYTERIENSPGNMERTVDLKNLAKGIYFVQVINENSSYTKKLLVE